MLCSNPDCKQHTSGPSDEGPHAVVTIGEAAHICAASPGGPRFDSNMSPEERASISNAIWLCARCHKLVDGDTARYPAPLLREWKCRHEDQMADTLRGKRAASNQRVLADSLEATTEMSRTPPQSPSPSDVEFVVSANYSMDKDAMIVIGEIGNTANKKFTIRDVRLLVPNVGEMRPDEIINPRIFYIEGHTWLGKSPFQVGAGDLIKIAWYFNAAGTSVRKQLDATQPLACELAVTCFPNMQLIKKMELFSIAKLREMSGGCSRL